MPFQLLKKYAKNESGSTAVEFAFVSMGFIFLIFMIFELGYIYWTWNTLQFAVENATRYTLANEDLTEEEVEEYVRDNMVGFDTSGNNPNIDVAWETVSGVNFVQVSATYDYSMFSSVLLHDLSDLTLSATSRLAIP